VKPKKNDPAREFIDALADVIADRVAAKLAEREKPIVRPERVPAWVSDPRRRKGERQTPYVGEWTIEKALRSAGLVTVGDPGYAEGLDAQLGAERVHEVELRARAQMRRAVRLFEKLVGTRPAASK
jgi:hypothetical protein